MASHLLNMPWVELTSLPGIALNAGGLIRVRKGKVNLYIHPEPLAFLEETRSSSQKED